MNGVFVKDLRIFANRRLQDLTIIDNSAYSFAYQMDHGIPIISWYDDRNDKELYNLISYLRVLSSMKDPRVINRHTFKLHSLYDDFKGKFEGAGTGSGS
jgi:CTD small phosphatase-like protein 2